MAEKIMILDDAYATAFAAADLWKKYQHEALRLHGIFSAALSGGDTPRFLYERLSEPALADTWNDTHLFQVDERLVPPGHPDSNLRMIRETLLDNIPIHPSNMHPVPLRPAAHESALLYGEELRRYFSLAEGEFPVFDLVVLGIGEDGHTASIFPGHPLMHEYTRIAGEVALDEKRHDRVTLTLPSLRAARHIIFFATGASKAPVMQRIIEERDGTLPACSVIYSIGPVEVLLDREAASKLGPGTPRP